MARSKINFRRIISILLALIMGALAAVLVNACTNEPAEQPENQIPPEEIIEPVKISYEQRVGVDYQIDITPYLEFIEPEDKYEYVFLVNPQNPLPADYVPENLTDCGHTRNDGRATQKLSKAAAEALKAFLAEGKLYDVTDVTVTSAYRDYNYQDYLFNMYFDRDWATGKFKTKAECEAHVLTYSTKPGTSEHQSGLCVDMHNLPSAEESFAYEPEAKWLADNCYRFGFILRYPEGKTDITGITYEPWHFRFVGREAATEMYELGLTLDEYVVLKSEELNN